MNQLNTAVTMTEAQALAAFDDARKIRDEAYEVVKAAGKTAAAANAAAQKVVDAGNAMLESGSPAAYALTTAVHATLALADAVFEELKAARVKYEDTLAAVSDAEYAYALACGEVEEEDENEPCACSHCLATDALHDALGKKEALQ